MFYSEKDDREKQLRFSIRKVSFGAASVAVAALYLFMGSGAVSAAEAQAVQSNEEVAADKDSETEEQQPTYAAPAAKEQGSATNTEAGDEGKQESHPGTKEEEVNSSERSETTTKTQSDEDSVSGDSSSPKSEGEGTRSEEARSKPKVRKRRDTPAPTATPTDEDPAANQTYEAPGDGASVDELAAKLKSLPETVENEKKLASIDQVGATKNITPGQVSELSEFGGWKAINGGKFAVASKTNGGVFPIETVNTVYSSKKGDTTHNWTWVKESVFDRSNNYALFLSKVRTQKNQSEETFDGIEYKSKDESPGIARGLKGFNGIEKTFKVYEQKVGSEVTIEFKTGYTGDIDGRKAKYKVELKAKKDGKEMILYTVEFDPSKNLENDQMTVTKATDGTTKSYFESLRSNIDKSIYNTELEKNENRPNGTPGKFKSKLIDIPKDYTDYTVSISSSDNQHLGMGYQINWEHYALPVTGEGFKVTQNTSKVAKDLAKKVYDKLIAQKEEDTEWSTPETKAAYEEKLQKIKEKIDSGASTSEYTTVVEEALEKQRQLDEGQEIKDKAKEAIAAKLKEKAEAIENNDKLSSAEKEAAKEAAKKAA
ncbi:YSIRK-type signal peptide-containing protein, partial [Streptococcus pseudopneumoniae]|uniref:YSIRK-type signal peptide-containing protein n=1 Tax=Streptococcus pseudopneumoniae TaxID=257758 RepID=UPI0039EE353F